MNAHRLINSSCEVNMAGFHITSANFEDMNGTEFEQVTAFLAAVEHGGFTAAGLALGRDGSILSRRVTALEKRLGLRLMERTTRRLALTEAGETFHQRMRGALSALQEIEQDTAATAASVRGTLRIALPATFGRMWVAPILPAFLAAHPDVTVEAAFEDRYVDLVAESFDVAIRIGTLTDSRLVARRLAPSRRMLCAAPAYLRAGRPSRPIWLAMPAWVSPAWPRIRFGICARTTRSRPFASAARWSPTMRTALCRPPLPARASPWCPTGWPAPNCAAASWCPCCPNIPCKTARRFTWCILPRAWFRPRRGHTPTGSRRRWAPGRGGILDPRRHDVLPASAPCPHETISAQGRRGVHCRDGRGAWP